VSGGGQKSDILHPDPLLILPGHVPKKGSGGGRDFKGCKAKEGK
jgi:hypothetical protein